MKKSFSLLLFSLIVLSAFSQPKIIYDDQYAGGWFKAVSNNGRFVVGGNPAYSKAYLVDTKTGEVKTITGSDYIDVYDVSDDGTTIVGKFKDPEATIIYKDIHGNDSLVSGIVPGLYKDGKWIAVERPKALNGDGWDGSIKTISGNGKLMGGQIPYYDAQSGTVSMTKFEPVIWDENGRIIQKLPIYTAQGGAGLSSMSDDGSVATGWYDGSLYGKNIIWKNGERIETSVFNGSGKVVSANGKFVGGVCGKGMLSPLGKPYIWSEEGGLTIVDCPAETQYGDVYGITNDGKRAVGFVDLAMPMTSNRHAFIIEDGVYYNFDVWIKENYNLEFPHGSFWAIQSISSDGNVMCGIGYYDGARDPWIIVLDESKLPDISSISTVKQELDVNVTFDAASRILNIDGEYTSASLYNNVGKCVLTDNQAKGTMNVSQLATGIYFAKVTKGKVARTFKIAITH